MDIIYKDLAILVANKPAGLASVPGGWEENAASLMESLEIEHGRLWIVHRLDKGTSGLVMFARSPEAHRELSMLFEKHEVRKTYHALVNGAPAWQEHTARHPLRANVGHSHRTMVDNAKGKTSETSFQVLERLGHYALLAASPATGRTHQVRVHAYALGFPLLGDRLYDSPPTDLIGRPALHAWKLEVIFRGNPYQFEAPYPEDFSKALTSLRNVRKAGG